MESDARQCTTTIPERPTESLFQKLYSVVLTAYLFTSLSWSPEEQEHCSNADLPPCHATEPPTKHHSSESPAAQSSEPPVDRVSDDHPAGRQSDDHPAGRQSDDHPAGRQSDDHPAGHQSNNHPANHQSDRQEDHRIGDQREDHRIDDQQDDESRELKPSIYSPSTSLHNEQYRQLRDTDLEATAERTFIGLSITS